MNHVSFKQVLEFYGTVGVPVLYAANLYATSLGGSVDIALPLRLAGLAAAFFGLVLWTISYFQLKRSFGVLPKTQRAVKTGFYKILKHPMYIGILLTFFGLSFANESGTGLVFTGIVMTPLLYIRARAEEKKLLVS